MAPSGPWSLRALIRDIPDFRHCRGSSFKDTVTPLLADADAAAA